jgi:hypothetical protein
MEKSNAWNAVIISMASISFISCSKGTESFSLLKDASGYKQQAVFVPKKIDILWVVDNSGSMETSQNSLATNFQSFINRFKQQKYDFQMAVTTTDAWEKQFNSNSIKARIRDGAILQTSPRIETHSNVFVMTPETPNIGNVFSTNIRQGTLGNGDERAFESFRQTLLDPFSESFRREDAFLAIIIVSDEEDFSGSTRDFENLETTYPVSQYKEFLDSYTKVAVFGKNYSVNVIHVDSASCKQQLSSDGFDRKISSRLPELADLTGGVKASLCSNYGTSLQLISDSIINLSSVFKLSREPLVETITVQVDGVSIPQDQNNGWTYNPQDLTVTFHGSAVPGANSNISIDFYPKSIKL